VGIKNNSYAGNALGIVATGTDAEGIVAKRNGGKPGGNLFPQRPKKNKFRCVGMERFI